MTPGCFFAAVRSNLELFQLGHPQGVAGIAGHTPVTAGGQRDRADLRPIGQTAALELLGKEAAIEVL